MKSFIPITSNLHSERARNDSGEEENKEQEETSSRTQGGQPSPSTGWGLERVGMRGQQVLLQQIKETC